MLNKTISNVDFQLDKNIRLVRVFYLASVKKGLKVRFSFLR